MIQVRVGQLFLSNMGFVVILNASGEERAVPIFIGAAEAQAIAIELQGVTVPRPLTHDLLKNVLDYLECRLKHVEVCDIRDGTYFGRLVLDLDESEIELDCRPSDAIALALRANAPILVHENVMEEAGRVLDSIIPEGGEIEPIASADKGETPAKPRSPVEILNQKLEEAVADERYEDAARFRDEIDRLKKHNDN